MPLVKQYACIHIELPLLLYLFAFNSVILIGMAERHPTYMEDNQQGRMHLYDEDMQLRKGYFTCN